MKLIRMAKSIILLLAVLGPVALYAGEASNEGDPNPIRFIHEANQVGLFCPKLQNCKGTPYKLSTIYRLSEPSNLNDDLWKIFSRISHDQAQIWADTILEADYVAEGKTRIDRIYEMRKYGFPIGYIVTYSEKAWNVTDCRYDGVRPSTLFDCTVGRIVESSFVSLDFKQYFYTDKTAAVFR